MDLAEKRKREFFGKQFNDFLERWKKKQHKTQKDFCAAAGVSKNIVTGWKKGKRFPQDAQLMKICAVFDVSPRAFNPFFDADKDFVENTFAIEQSERVQRYAEEKGLNESFYQYLTGKSWFLERFPFAGHWTFERPGENFDLVKYEFSDSKEHRIMLTEKDIDFLVDLQGHIDIQIDYMMYRRRQKLDRERVERLVNLHLEHIDIDRAEVLERLYRVDLSKENRFISEKEIFETVRDIAKEKGIVPHYTKTDVVADLRHIDDNIEKWLEWGRLNKREAEAEKAVRELTEFRQKAIDSRIERLRAAGLLDED